MMMDDDALNVFFSFPSLLLVPRTLYLLQWVVGEGISGHDAPGMVPAVEK